MDIKHPQVTYIPHISGQGEKTPVERGERDDPKVLGALAVTADLLTEHEHHLVVRGLDIINQRHGSGLTETNASVRLNQATAYAYSIIAGQSQLRPQAA